MINKNICEIRVERAESGLVIYAKSKEIEEYFKSHCLEIKQGSGDYASLKHYYIEATIGNNRYTLNRWGYGLYNSDAVNLSFLRTVGLSDGVIYPIKGVYSKEYIQTWVSRAKNSIREFYGEYIKKLSIKIVIIENGGTYESHK